MASCSRCSGCGLVSVYVSGSMRGKAIRFYGYDKGSRITCAVACSCPAGDIPASRIRRYDPRRDFVVGEERETPAEVSG